MACVWESFSISCIGSFYPGPSGRAWRGFSKKATDRASRDSQPSSFWSMIPACAEMCMTRSTSWWYLIRHSCNKSHVQEIKTSVGPPTGAEHLQCIDVDVDFTAQNLCKFGCCRERCNWQSKKGMSWWIDLCGCPFLPSFPADVFRFGIVLTLILPLRLKALNVCAEFMKSFAQLDRKIWQKHVECRRPRCC